MTAEPATYPKEARGKSPVVNHLLSFRSDPFSFLVNNGRECGPVFLFRVLSRKIFVINHPDWVRRVLISNVSNYSRLKPYSIMVELLGQGLITTEGEEWRKRRRIAQPAFHKAQLAELILAMRNTVNEVLSERSDMLMGECDVEKEMNRVTIETLGNTILRNDLHFELDELKAHFTAAWEYLSYKRFRWSKVLNRLPNPKKHRGQKAISTLRQTILRIIEKRREDGEQANDLLGMLMAAVDEETEQRLTNEELLDEVVTLFTAGHDTTAVALTWAIYLIGTHPETEQKIYEEIKDRGDTSHLDVESLRNYPYLDQVISEVMRLYPPVWTFGRRSVEDDEYMGIKIPAGSTVTVPCICMHRNPDYWEKPDEFYPEHFTEKKVAERHRLAYFPFGAGQRLCIGEHFALMEIKLVLIHLISRYRIRILNEERPAMNLLITIKPATPVMARFEPR